MRDHPYLFGMTPDQWMLHRIVGDVRHPYAPEGVCGATDPRDGDKWCTQEPKHADVMHNTTDTGTIVIR